MAVLEASTSRASVAVRGGCIPVRVEIRKAAPGLRPISSALEGFLRRSEVRATGQGLCPGPRLVGALSLALPLGSDNFPKGFGGKTKVSGRSEVGELLESSRCAAEIGENPPLSKDRARIPAFGPVPVANFPMIAFEGASCFFSFAVLRMWGFRFG